MNTTSYLGSVDALVAFKAFKIPGASLVYASSDFAFSESAIIKRFAYSSTGGLKVSTTGKTFHADRYGGDGLRTHGGSGRCGIRGRYQVKGIGPTPLVGVHSDPRYSSGRLTLVHAIEELIWGDVLSQVLPHGASRILALIATEPLARSNALSEDGPFALAVREVPIRPAHFCRAIYFVQGPGTPRFKPDAIRVAKACASMVKVLPAPYSSVPDGNYNVQANGDGIDAGLNEFALRVADQMAASKSRKIMHGALSPSNICLDGRWIDFGSTSLLPAFANTSHFVPGFWSDIQSIFKIFQDLSFYVNKYVKSQVRNPINSARLNQVYLERFNYSLRINFIRKLGYPDEVVASLSRDRSLHELGAMLIFFARVGTERNLPDDASALQGVGLYKLDEIVGTLTIYGMEGSCDSRLAPLITTPKIRSELIIAFRALNSAAVRGIVQAQITKEAARRLFAINARKLNKSAPFLETARLSAAIAEQVSANFNTEHFRSKIEEFCQTTIRDAITMLSDPSGLQSVCCRGMAEVIKYDCVTDSWLVCSDVTIQSYQWNNWRNEAPIWTAVKSTLGVDFLEAIS